MKRRIIIVFVLFILFSSRGNAGRVHFRPALIREGPLTSVRVAVILPLYLDSAFNNYQYNLGGLSIPRYFLPGLEFYNGVMAAADSMQIEGLDLDIWIFDSRKKGVTTDSLASLISSLNFSLVIASFSTASEQKIFADLAVRRNIPLISATYPNDAFLSDNPFFVMVNSTLKTHIESIYRYIQRKYPVGRVIFVTRQGGLEDRIQGIFANVGKRTYPMKYQVVKVRDTLTTNDIIPLLDSNAQNVIVCGSVNENFGTALITALDALSPSYTTVAVGMPTWDGLKAVRTVSNENLNILYSTPYNFPSDNTVISSISAAYRTKFNGRPSDMFFKGFETTYFFSKLMLKYHNDFLNNLSDTTFHISLNYRFHPVDNNGNGIPDYIENKNLYFVDMSQGTIKGVDLYQPDGSNE